MRLFEAQLLRSLEQTPPRIPIIVGPDSSGRTRTLLDVQHELGPGRAQYLNVERLATTPERFAMNVMAPTPFRLAGGRPPTPANGSPKSAFDGVLALFASATTEDGGPATFLLDEVLEIRTFENFPGLRHVAGELLRTLAESPNRFVLTSRYTQRAHRLVRDTAPRFSVTPIPPLGLDEVATILREAGVRADRAAAEAPMAQALTDGRPAHVAALARVMAGSPTDSRDAVDALVDAMRPPGELCACCELSYEVRLHRARGYGALKAILDVLAEQEPLTLTEISQRLRRTPGSTKDYLSWLEDVDLVAVERKKYRIANPLLRLWLRLQAHGAAPTDAELDGEVRAFAASVRPESVGRTTLAAPAADDDRLVRAAPSGIIEID
jgi:hypothetical protein